MSLQKTKKGLKLLVEMVEDIGTVDIARLDPDDLPRKIQTVTRATPYWSLQLSGFRDRQADFGSTTRNLFRDYTLRLEGWLGFVGVADRTDEWEDLVTALANHLQTQQRAAARVVPGFRECANLTVEGLGVIRLGDGTARAHYARLTCDVMTFTSPGVI